MKKVPDLREIPDLPKEIIDAGFAGELILFVGAGVSRMVGLPSWAGLAANALEYLRNLRALDYSELAQLSALDPRKQLSIAKALAEEQDLNLDWRLLLHLDAKDIGPYEYINAIGCVCVTTNYDELLSPRFLELGDDTEQGPASPNPVIRIAKRGDFFSKHLEEPGTVVHLHGSISLPETMVVTTKEYLEHYDDPMVQQFLGDLFSRKTVLFLGYSLEEAEILEHILRRGRVGKTGDRRRFALQGFFRSDQPLYSSLHRYYETSFGVHLLGFLRDFRNYDQQLNVLKDWSGQISVNRPTLVEDLARLNEVLQDG